MKAMKRGFALVVAATVLVNGVPVLAEAKPAVVQKKVVLYLNGTETEKKVTLQTKNSKGYKVSFKSSKPAIATVTAKGVVKAKKTGEMVVTVKFEREKTIISKKVKVEVKKKAVASISEGKLSVVQTGNKTIQLDSTVPFDEENPIVVSKGSNTLNAAILYSEDRSSATITLPMSIRKGEYQVTVGEQTALLNGEVAVATKIEIDNRFKLNAAALSDYVTGGYIKYRVFDQFGGDLTKETHVSVYSSMGTPSIDPRSGLISIMDGTIGEGNSIFRHYQLGNKVNVTVRTDEGISCTQDCVMSDMSVATEMSVAEVYNPEGMILTDAFNGIDEFYVLLNVKDQYGEVYTDANDPFTQKILNTLDVTFFPNNTNLVMDDNNKTDMDYKHSVFVTVNKEGQDYIALKLGVESDTKAKVGTASLRLFGCCSYKMNTEDITVAYGTTVDKFSAEPVDEVVLGEDAEFDYEALDAYGQPVTELASLKELLRNDDRSLTDFGKDFKFVKEGESIKLYRRSDAINQNQVGFAHTMVITKTHQACSITYNLMAKARPTYVTGYHGKVMNTLSNTSVVFETRYFDFADQYGRTMNIDDVYTYVNQFRLKVEGSNEDYSIPGDGTLMLASNGTRTVTPTFTTGSRPLIFKLVSSTGVDITDGVYKEYENNRQFDVLNKTYSESSAYRTNMSVLKFSSFKNFELETIPLLYAGSEEGNVYAFDLKLYGIYQGKRIEIPNDPEYYSVVLPTAADLEYDDGNQKPGLAYAEGTGKLYSTFEYGQGETGKDDFYMGTDQVKELERTIEIVIGGQNTQVIRQTVKISKEAPKVVGITLRYPIDYTPDTSKRGRIIDGQFKISSSVLNSDPSMMFRNCMDVTDQYGASTTGDKQTELDVTSLTPRFFVNDIEVEQGVKSSRIVKHNGTITPEFTGFQAGDTFTLTYSFGTGTQAAMEIVVY